MTSQFTRSLWAFEMLHHRQRLIFSIELLDTRGLYSRVFPVNIQQIC